MPEKTSTTLNSADQRWPDWTWAGPWDQEKIKTDARGWIAALSGDCLTTLAQYLAPVAPSNRLTRPTPKTVTIYFIGAENGPIKIGMAARVQTRLRDLQLMNSQPLRLLASIEGPHRLEREYHKRFAAHRLHGEWFSPHPDILAEIDRLNTDIAA